VRFESVADAQRRARRRLPKSVYSAVLAGSEQGLTVGDNVAAFDELTFLPRVAPGIPELRAQALSVLGLELSLPVICSPAGVQAVHPEGEVAVGRASASVGTAMGLSSFASKPMEAVVAANPQTLFQLFWLGGRERILRILERARAAGAWGLIVTLDWTFAHRRDRGTPAIPERLDLRSMVRLAPEALMRPRWLGSYLRRRQLPDLTAPNLAAPGGAAPTFPTAYGEWMQTPLPSWSDLAWLREQWAGPLVIKGIMHVDDARRAVEIGADAISVSNHGGNSLDGTPASIRVLPAIAETVGGHLAVLLDGGIRRGGDVVKALALGARAVLIGRAYLWGLAAGGEAGVVNVLEILRSGIDETLIGLGHASIDEISAADVVVPDRFSAGEATRPREPVAASPLRG
jgi:heme/flavin dehydrogenase (mycofactocin system)